jgi:hypothetical protein
MGVYPLLHNFNTKMIIAKEAMAKVAREVLRFPPRNIST